MMNMQKGARVAATLKDQNRAGLYAGMAANLALFFAFPRWNMIVAGDWATLSAGWASVVPAGIGLIIVSVLTAQIDALMKARLVFVRWRNPLPASEAFTRWGLSDPRV